ncbi:DUF488 domain-containing protein [Arthrobacter rhombi]|uniref:DNA repair protein n=1 Tax=Arthrobacter rhombi TaxID=71253 RepID=A0A1R4EPW4_9MICC|nr:DUF488 domain-containing protein [Arthrobacter rhombi]SJM45652.1 hypothetical protein FM101_00140 [Arthrobacter rhombi]
MNTPAAAAPPPTLHTVGHSTHPVEEFVELLRAHGVQRIVDVRTVPKSRHNPQFGIDQLPASLAGYGLDYQRIESLGGLRHTTKASPNTGWRNASFRGYADYMQTPEFDAGIQQLVASTAERPVAIMCAEAVPWRCHRSMIGDAMLVRGFEVLDIFSPTKATAHTLTSFAQVEGTTITYPPEKSTPSA